MKKLRSSTANRAGINRLGTIQESPRQKSSRKSPGKTNPNESMAESQKQIDENIANLKTDADTLSETDPILARMINEKLSNLTDLQNQNLSSQMDKLRIAQDNLTEIEYNMVQKYEGFKCDKLLTRIDKNIKLLQYHLGRIVTSYKNYHTVIPTNNNSQGIWIDVIEGSVPIYCKVDTSNRMPPLKLYIELKEERKSMKTVRSLSRKRKSVANIKIHDENRPDWKVYVSDKFVEPNEVNSLYTFTN
jgi:hypothetical protein